MGKIILEEIAVLGTETLFNAIRDAHMPFIIPNRAGPDKKNYTYAGCDPFVTLRSQSGVTTVTGEENFSGDCPFTALSKLLSTYKNTKGPFPFNGGAFGYFSYDLKDITQPAKTDKGHLKPPGSLKELPYALIGLYDPVIVIDHNAQKGYVVSVSGNRTAVEELIKKLTRPASNTENFADSESFTAGIPVSNMRREDYIKRVNDAKDYIGEGDIYQINISQSFEAPFFGDPFELFLAVYNNSPAPFASYFETGPFKILSNTPERLLKIEGGLAITEPIKGTRPRGANPEEDGLFRAELKASEKERAEHVMIVDLERNDIGYISEPGSVKVSSFGRIERLKGLHHMVSTVTGRVREGLDTAACLKAFFPGGSITGAPKVRAIEIIDELEPNARAIYTGAIGWFDLAGDCDLSMVIRTAVVSAGKLQLSVGSGIVADSQPEAEYEETLLKAEDFFNIISA